MESWLNIPLSTMWGHSERRLSPSLEECSYQGNKHVHAGTLTSDFQSLQLWKIISHSLKGTSLWYSVMAAQANNYTDSRILWKPIHFNDLFISLSLCVSIFLSLYIHICASLIMFLVLFLWRTQFIQVLVLRSRVL